MKIEFCPYCNRRFFMPKVRERVHIEFEYYLEFYFCECRQFFFRWHLANWKLYSEITTSEFALKDDKQFREAIRMVLKLEFAYLNGMYRYMEENPVKVPFEGAKIEEVKVQIEDQLALGKALELLR